MILHETCDICHKYEEISEHGVFQNKKIQICKNCFEKQMALLNAIEKSPHVFFDQPRLGLGRV